MDKLKLGLLYDYSDLPVYISKHTWDCNWYWKFGWLGNKDCHFHMEELIEGSFYSHQIFTKTSITQNQWWIIRDLFIQAYSLKKAAATFKYGGFQNKLEGVTDVIQSKELEDLMNEKLKILLDKTWEYLESILGG